MPPKIAVDTTPYIPHFGGMKWAEISKRLEAYEKANKKIRVVKS